MRDFRDSKVASLSFNCHARYILIGFREQAKNPRFSFSQFRQ